jgi:hypothetical protein
MRHKLIAFFPVSAIFVLTSGPVFAHHGGGMFDMAHSTNMNGTVANFEFVNPHGMIYIDVKDFKGNIQKWAVETRGGPNVLAKAGWDKDTVKPGNQITLVGHLAKNGSNNIRLVKIVFSNGMELYPDSNR